MAQYKKRKSPRKTGVVKAIDKPLGQLVKAIDKPRGKLVKKASGGQTKKRQPSKPKPKGGTVARRGTTKPNVGKKGGTVARRGTTKPNVGKKGGTVARRGTTKPNVGKKGGTVAARPKPKQSRNVAHGGGLGSVEGLRSFAEGMDRGIKKAARSKIAEKKFKNYKP